MEFCSMCTGKFKAVALLHCLGVWAEASDTGAGLKQPSCKAGLFDRFGLRLAPAASSAFACRIVPHGQYPGGYWLIQGPSGSCGA